MILSWINSWPTPVHAHAAVSSSSPANAMRGVHALISNMQSSSVGVQCKAPQSRQPARVVRSWPPSLREPKLLQADARTCRFQIMGSGEARRGRIASGKGCRSAGRRKRTLTRRQLTAPRKRGGPVGFPGAAQEKQPQNGVRVPDGPHPIGVERPHTCMSALSSMGNL